LIPGIGNDGAIVDMHDAGYQNLTAFDYAIKGVACSRSFWAMVESEKDPINLEESLWS
jgi:hypothetical protein